MDILNSLFSDLVNMVIFVGKYHIYICKLKKAKSSFSIFLHDFVRIFQGLLSNTSAVFEVERWETNVMS